MFMEDYFNVKREVAEKRMNMCKECEHFIKETKTCRQCGCYMEYKVKLRSVSCPLHKWTREDLRTDVTN